MIKLQVLGHLGSDAEVKQIGGKDVCVFDVAHTSSYKDANGVQHSDTIWVSVFLSAKSPVIPYLKKGTQVYILGTPKFGTYTSQKDGSVRCTVSLRSDFIQLAGSATGSSDNQKPKAYDGY